MDKTITRNKAIKTIYAICEKKNINNELLHKLIKEHYDIDSIANADSKQLEKILSILNPYYKYKVEIPSQIYMIYKKAEKWGISKESIDSFIHKKFKVSSVYSLSQKQKRGLVKVVFSFIEKKRKEWITENLCIEVNGKICKAVVGKYIDGSNCLIIVDYITLEKIKVATIYVGDMMNDIRCDEFVIDMTDGGYTYTDMVKSKIIKESFFNFLKKDVYHKICKLTEKYKETK